MFRKFWISFHKRECTKKGEKFGIIEKMSQRVI